MGSGKQILTMNTKLLAVAILAALAASQETKREKRSPIGVPGTVAGLPTVTRLPTATRLPTTSGLPNIVDANLPTVWLGPDEDWPEGTEGDIFAYVPHVD